LLAQDEVVRLVPNLENEADAGFPQQARGSRGITAERFRADIAVRIVRGGRVSDPIIVGKAEHYGDVVLAVEGEALLEGGRKLVFAGSRLHPGPSAVVADPADAEVFQESQVPQRLSL
jgi:hypothetical protein